MTLSTGQPSTLGVWRDLTATVFGEDSPATAFWDAKISEQGRDMPVDQDEQQIMGLVYSLHFGTTRPSAICFRCGRTPAEIPEYQPVSTGRTDLSPEDYVWSEEGTLNPENGHFACDECYIAIGMPAGRGNNRWRAP